MLLVISLVITIAYPSMSRGRTAFHLRAVGRDVIASLRLARETAVTEQKVMMIRIDRQARRIRAREAMAERELDELRRRLESDDSGGVGGGGMGTTSRHAVGHVAATHPPSRNRHAGIRACAAR